jgi:hypothetical protein
VWLLSNFTDVGANMKSRSNLVTQQVLTSVLAIALFGLSVDQKVLASESTDYGTWFGPIKCHGLSKIKRRTPTFRIDGDQAFLTNYGKSGETYESKIKNGKAKFKGSYSGIANGQSFNKLVKATVKILKNGDVKISGMRGRHSRCSGILKKF